MSQQDLKEHPELDEPHAPTPEQLLAAERASRQGHRFKRRGMTPAQYEQRDPHPEEVTESRI